MSIKPSKVRANIIIDRDFKAEIELLAKQENRSFSNFVVTVLQEYAKKTAQNRKVQALTRLSCPP